MRKLSSALLALTVLCGCSHRHPVSIAVALPPPVSAPTERILIATPPPAAIPEPPLPVLKPGTELSLAELERLMDQASPKGPSDRSITLSQKAIGRGRVMPANTSSAIADAPPFTQQPFLVGLTQTETTKLLGAPAERQKLPPSEIWTYHSTICDVRLFFYPEVGGRTFRALTYQIDEPGATDRAHSACFSSLLKLPRG